MAGVSTATITLTKSDPDTGDAASYDATTLTTNGWVTSNGGQTYTKTGTYGSVVLNTATNVLTYTLDQNLANPLKKGAQRRFERGRPAARRRPATGPS